MQPQAGIAGDVGEGVDVVDSASVGGAGGRDKDARLQTGRAVLRQYLA